MWLPFLERRSHDWFEAPKWHLVDGSHHTVPDPLEQLSISMHTGGHWGLWLLSRVVLLWGQSFHLAKPQHADWRWLTGSGGIVFSVNHNHGVTRPLFTIFDRTTNLFTPSPPLHPYHTYSVITRSCQSNCFKLHLLQHRWCYRTSQLNWD